MLERSQRRPREAALRRLAGTVALSLALVSGCAGDPETTATAAAPPTTAAAATTSAPAPIEGPVVLGASHPTRLHIPAIDVDAGGVIDLGLQPNGALEVPVDGKTVGWYTESPTPGERGPAVLAAHVDWNGPGVFYDLHQLKSGDEVTVDRADGTSAVFQVQRVEQYPKDQFPTLEVYGDVAGAELRLITCGGEFDQAADSYRDNIVVYAGLVRTA
jgi:LPXTG-site transpeptidase (sortase) family protein